MRTLWWWRQRCFFEAGWETLVDEVWTTESPVELVIDRLEARNGLGEEEVRKRIDSQMSRPRAQFTGNHRS